jgi:hypothetical protein
MNLTHVLRQQSGSQVFYGLSAGEYALIDTSEIIYGFLIQTTRLTVEYIPHISASMLVKSSTFASSASKPV